jgi:hypothetical protein
MIGTLLEQSGREVSRVLSIRRWRCARSSRQERSQA